MDAIIPVDPSELNATAGDTTMRSRTDSITKTTPTRDNEIHSSDVIEPVVKATRSTSAGFDVELVYEAFVATLKEPRNPKSAIGTQDYINGYRELIK